MSTRRVDSSTSGPLMRIPSCAPRPVPTIRAVGVASPRAHGQAMISTATAAVNATVALSVAAAVSQNPSVATARAITTGTNTAATRSASRWTGALPVWASWTSRAIWARAVSAPTRVASTTSRPPALTVAPVTASPGPTSTGTGSPVRSDASMAEVPSVTVPSVATFSPGRTMKRSPTASWSTGTRVSTPSRSTATSLAPSSSSAVQGGARTALGPGFEEAPGEDEHGDPGRYLEVHLRTPVAALRGPREPVGHADLAGRSEEQGVERPAEGRQHTDRDEGVHGGRGVAQVEPGGPVERPCAPRHDRRGEGEGQPLPGVELQRGDHRQEDHRDGQNEGDEEPGAQGGGLVGFTLGGRRRRRAVARAAVRCSRPPRPGR